MKKLVFTIFISALLLMGCATNKPDVTKEPPQESKQKYEKVINMDGKVFVNRKNVTAVGSSNLPKGTKLVMFISNNESEVKEFTVDKDGGFSAKMERKPFTEDTDINIVMFTDQQSEEFKKHYGKHGEKLKGIFVFDFEKDGQKYKGLSAVSPASKDESNVIRQDLMIHAGGSIKPLK